MNFLDFFFPKNCLECKKEGKYICELCLAKVSKKGWSGNTYSIFRYEGVIRKAIIALKYKFSFEIAKELAEVCVKNLNLNLTTNYYSLIPVPLHYLRQNMRGFNQSEEVGKLIAKSMNWKFVPELLIKTKKTHQQVGLAREERLKNLENVFSVNPRYSSTDLFNYSSVILFDDVFTTGSTIKEAEKVLKEAGVREVWGLTIAR
ncbi:MAG TPA: ComF family protein [Alphaproteobacteria bacterium]|jgi:ComF family protein|nr:ComF family protein [Alphaproteobacteria bacterium]